MRLIDCFIEVIAYTAFFLEHVEEQQPRFEQVKNTYRRLFTKSQKLMRQGAFSRDDYKEAQFAICAWADEAILISKWEERENWKTEQLQRQYFDTVNAGEEFFDHLKAILPDNKGVLEVYFACLAMGFQGKYYTVPDSLPLDEINEDIMEKYRKSSLLPASIEGERLFPGAYSSETGVFKRHKFGMGSPITIFYFVGPLAGWYVLFYFYSDILNKIVASFTGAAI